MTAYMTDESEISTSNTTSRSPGADNLARLLARQECERIVERIKGLAKGGGDTTVDITGWWNGELRWARNRVRLASDRRSVRIMVTRTMQGRAGQAATDQTDDVSTEGVLRAAERCVSLIRYGLIEDMPLEAPEVKQYPTVPIWSNTTFDVSAETRGTLAGILIEGAEQHEMLSAGYLEMRGAQLFGMDKYGKMRDATFTQSQCSMTVRHPKGTGSGWAGLSSYDWATIDGAALAKRALDKCLLSLNPVKIEPGRYTTILEPQALCGLMEGLMTSFSRELPEVFGQGPFVQDLDPELRIFRSKLGLKIMDERVTIGLDPSDPRLGTIMSTTAVPRNLIENGVLTNLEYTREYALGYLYENDGMYRNPSFRMSGGTTSMEEMIETTKRGLLVTRFSGLRTLNTTTLISTGVTRDGLWLIENGKITKAVNNMRIVESPLFVLNQIEQLGVPVPVFRPDFIPTSHVFSLKPAVLPPIKTKDFSFTATVDAI